jgi:lipopolysaccharide transport system ATP-binding protein
VNDDAIQIENLGKRFELQTGPAYARFSELLAQIPSMFLPKSGKSSPSDFWALCDISFSVKQGEILGIIGRNGAGKSTLLKVLSRITHPTTGRVRIKGTVSALLEVGTGFHPELTGRENIYLNGSIIGMTTAQVRKHFDEIVAFAEVEKFLDTPVKHYSSGMYVRLGFAVAAHLQTDIMIIDEVLAVGDAAFQKKCLGKMRNVAHQGHTVLMVSHNMGTIVQHCQRVVALNQGRVIAIDKPHIVVDQYLRGLASIAGQVKWDNLATAPGNDVVRLRSIRILQEGSTDAAGDVDISKDVLVEFTYTNFKPDATLFVGLWLKHSLGTLVLTSQNMPSVALNKDQWMGQPFPEGTFQTVCRFPANFFNDGEYLVTAILGSNTNYQHAFLEDCITFTVHDTGEMRKDQADAFAGVVRPKLAWETQQLPQAP